MKVDYSELCWTDFTLEIMAALKRAPTVISAAHGPEKESPTKEEAHFIN